MHKTDSCTGVRIGMAPTKASSWTMMDLLTMLPALQSLIVQLEGILYLHKSSKQCKQKLIAVRFLQLKYLAK